MLSILSLGEFSSIPSLTLLGLRTLFSYDSAIETYAITYESSFLYAFIFLNLGVDNYPDVSTADLDFFPVEMDLLISFLSLLL